MLRLLLLSVFLFPGVAALAVTPYKRTLSVKSNTYIKDGVFIGGKASQGSSLLGVRRIYSAKLKMERVIVDLGDHQARPAGQSPGYYQVSMDAANRRVVVDLAQLRFTKVSEAQLQNLFHSSPYVAEVALTLDPEDKGATMVLKLKRPMRMEVFQLQNKKKAGRVLIDLTPVGESTNGPALSSRGFTPVSPGANSVRSKDKALSRGPVQRKNPRSEAFE